MLEPFLPMTAALGSALIGAGASLLIIADGHVACTLQGVQQRWQARTPL